MFTRDISVTCVYVQPWLTCTYLLPLLKCNLVHVFMYNLDWHVHIWYLYSCATRYTYSCTTFTDMYISVTWIHVQLGAFIHIQPWLKCKYLLPVFMYNLVHLFIYNLDWHVHIWYLYSCATRYTYSYTTFTDMYISVTCIHVQLGTLIHIQPWLKCTYLLPVFMYNLVHIFMYNVDRHVHIVTCIYVQHWPTCTYLLPVFMYNLYSYTTSH